MAVTKTQDYKSCFKKNVTNTVLYLKKSFQFVSHINKIWKEERTFVIQVKQQVSLGKIVKITVLTLLEKQISSQPLIRISY